MCFEFEALYWAKIAEEELQKKEDLRKQEALRAHSAARDKSRDKNPDSLQEDPLVV